MSERGIKDVASTYVLCPHLRNRGVFQFAENGTTEGNDGMTESQNSGIEMEQKWKGLGG
jgi:hypothetical protein